MEYVVSPDGLRGNDGSAGRPWPLDTGIARLLPGDVLYLREGIYPGQVTLQGLHGTPANPIVIRSFPGEQAAIDGAVGEVRAVPNDQWTPGQDGEYVSAQRFPHGGDIIAQGSFLGPGPYTRLITHSTLEDLQAPNQRFGPIADSDRLPGPTVIPRDASFPRRPWVYMGPGLFQDEGGRIHIRLSPTANDMPGFPDYGGETDPRQVPLAIWTSSVATLHITGCTSVYLTDLSVRYGTTTIHIENSDDIRLDHVSVLAGSYGVEFGDQCSNSAMTHCLVDGGMPPWYFRSDRKDGYDYLLPDGAIAHNGLGEVTMHALMHGAPTCTKNTVRYCEFVNGHDLYVFGAGLEFSRNWVSNLNDDAIFAEPEGITDLRIFENVVEQSLTAVNFARPVAGHGVSVYRNLIDLRRPTASTRPQPHGGPPPLELGHLFKGNDPDGPLDLFHNTIVVKDQTEDSSYAHFRSYTGDSPRRSFNNIFVAIDTVPTAQIVISWLPKPTWPAATDGNCYYMTGAFNHADLLHQPAYHPGGDPAQSVPWHDFQSLDELRGVPGDPQHPPSRVFIDSQGQYPPGYEASSIAADPRFRRFDSAADAPRAPGGPPGDDFRLRWDSPARQHGITLPDDLRALDNAPSGEKPDIGCFRLDDPPLSVGVDARRQFPATQFSPAIPG